jgi:hypothetical protein
MSGRAGVNKWTILLAFISLFQFGFGTTTEAAGNSVQKCAEITGNHIDVARTVKALRKIRTDSGETTIPPAARPLLTSQHQLRELISKTLNSDGNRSKTPDLIRKAILSELRKQGITFVKPETTIIDKDYVDPGYTYGEIYKVAVETIPHHPDLIAATTTIGVCRGTDTSLYIFEKKKQQWELIMAQEANDYEKVSGTQGSFQYVVSPLSETGQFFVVTKNVSPWCTSNWQIIRYSVFRAGPTPYQPIKTLQQEDTIFLGNEDGIITLLPDGFNIEFEGNQSLDTGVLIRRHVLTYKVKGDQVLRVPPFATEPEGFLDEWFDLPWEEASKWIEPSASPVDFNEWHQRFHAERSGEEIRFSTNFVFDPPACQVTEGQWQVGIEFSPETKVGSLPDGMPSEAYFTIILKDGAYFLKSISASSLPKCDRSKEK